MLAPPARRRAARLRKARERSAAARRQARKRQREREHVHLYRFPLADRAVEGLIVKFILEEKLTEAEALDHRNVEREIAAMVEEEGYRCAR